MFPLREGGGLVLPYRGYIGMRGPKGYGFFSQKWGIDFGHFGLKENMFFFL